MMRRPQYPHRCATCNNDLTEERGFWTTPHSAREVCLDCLLDDLEGFLDTQHGHTIWTREQLAATLRAWLSSPDLGAPWDTTCL